MSQINAYLNFNGQCREAMTFYRDCFGGELVMQKIAESPMAATLPSEMDDQILHSSLTRGDILLMGSDMIGQHIRYGNLVALCYNGNDDEEMTTCFEKLAVGGVVITPLHQSVWGATFGELTDRYGLRWLFNCKKV